MNDTALVIIDVQNDFCPGGALPVADGDAVVPRLNRYTERVRSAGGAVVASRDWHPRQTRHFTAGGGPWPVHCVQDTAGAAFHPDLVLPEDTLVITKGDNPDDDGYSVFDGHDGSGRTLEEALHERGIHRLLIGGLATDYCVRASVLDARKLGFATTLLLDAIRGIDIRPDDIARALDEMMRAGATTATLATIDAAAGGVSG